uniref:Defensin-like protein n=1 Tax=Aegilops tauschii subsp. strangulata TaxID=200361 RepID=A0A453PS84_AEGTS
MALIKRNTRMVMYNIVVALLVIVFMFSTLPSCQAIQRRLCRDLAGCTDVSCQSDCLERGFRPPYQLECETNHHHLQCCCRQFGSILK